MIARNRSLCILLTTVVLTGLAGQALAQNPAPPPAPAAVVNGEVISWTDVEMLMKERGPSPTPLSEVQRKQMQVASLEMLIDDMLMRQFLRKSGLKVDPAEVAKRVAELEASLKKQGKTLQDFYRETN